MPFPARYLAVFATCVVFAAAAPNQASAQCYSGQNMSYEAGLNAAAPANYSTAIGAGASAVCENSVAVGTNSEASGGPGGSTAIGSHAQATGPSTAIGTWARAFQTNSLAAGNAAWADGVGAIALGTVTRAHHDNSIALGYIVETSAANQVVIGNADNFYTLTGIASASSTAAQTGNYRYVVTTDEHGNLAVAEFPSNAAAANAAAPNVIDDLTTGGTTDALSAQQGVVINTRLTNAETSASNAANAAANAQSTATTAVNNAANAQTSADTARDEAATAQTTANNALSTAQSAESSAASAQGTATTALSTANQAATTAQGALQTTGGTMTGNINMGGHRLTGLASPVHDTDAATKGYVDQRFSGFELDLQSVHARLGSLEHRVDSAMQGVAIAMAMGGVAIPAGKTFAIGANVATYGGKEAFAAQTAVQVAPGMIFSSALGFGGGKAGGRMGLMAAW